jgi:hypothetical protein
MDDKPRFKASVGPRHVMGCTATLWLQLRDAAEAGRGRMSVHKELVMATNQGKEGDSPRGS